MPVEIWASFESNFGLVVACMPALRPLFIRALGSKGTSRNRHADSKTSTPFSDLSAQKTPRNSQPLDSDGDKAKLIPLGNITVSTTMEVDSDHRKSIDMEIPNPFERDKRCRAEVGV